MSVPYKEFGTEHSQVIVLLHGGGLSWWNYRDAARILSERYHVVLPILDGHGGSPRAFTTMESCADAIIRLVEQHWKGKVLALGGLSLGGQVALEILSRKPDFCPYALIESALVKPMKLTNLLLGPSMDMSFGLIQKKWFSKLQFAWLGMPWELFDDYYRDTCAITKESMTAFLKANSAYTIKPTLTQTRAKVLVVCGSRETGKIKSSAGRLRDTIPGSRLEIRKGFVHGELSMGYPSQYARMLTSLWETERSE